jgi:hypothetical protein
VSGRESGRESHSAADPQTLEVVPGRQRDDLEGWIPPLASEQEIGEALEHAFSYRGDVTVTRKDGTSVEGYVFDRRAGRGLSDSFVRVIARSGEKLNIAYSDIAALAFSGRDMAAGKNWENWVRQYWERKAAGEKDISLQPEELE